MDLALTITLVGITVVFSALIILSFLIYLLSKIVNYKNNNVDNGSGNGKKKDVSNNTLKTNEDTINTALNAASTNEINFQDDSELVAVITAAILATIKKTNPHAGIRVKSFRRIQDNSPAWNVAGKMALLNTRIK